MKINEHFIVHTEGDEVLLVPTAEAKFFGIVRGNKTLAAILRQLEQGASREEIIRALKERFEAEDGVIEEDVDSSLDRLRSIGAIDE